MKLLLPIVIFFTSQILPQNQINLSKLEIENHIRATELVSSQAKQNFTYQAERKSPALAILYSLLLPGMGELYAGNYSAGKYFTIAEGGLWLTYFGINSYGNWQVNRYKAYAASTGGINAEGKDDEYYSTISEYNSIHDYNNRMALDRRFNRILSEETHYWNWGTTDTRRAYRSMWVSSEQSFNNLRFVVGALIINRLASAVMAVRATTRYNRDLSQEVSWNIFFGVEQVNNIPSGMNLNLITRF